MKVASTNANKIRSEVDMTQTQSITHLSCFIEAVAIAKQNKCNNCDDLKALLQQKGYEALIASETVEELSPQLPLAS